MIRMGVADGECGPEAVCFCTGAPGHLSAFEQGQLLVSAWKNKWKKQHLALL